MSKRLAALTLTLVILGGVSAGMPLHSSGHECSMPEMAGMDCCKKATQAERVSPDDLIARLCCALNCSQEGTTGVPGVQLPSPSTTDIPTPHQIPVRAHFGIRLDAFSSSHSPPNYSNPAYIRHVALLI
jgi:hypothetical protein